jgi:hypothetical protein
MPAADEAEFLGLSDGFPVRVADVLPRADRQELEDAYRLA